MVASWTPCVASATNSREGPFVAAMRRRRSTSAACGKLTRKGRTASALAALALDALWDPAPVGAGCCASAIAGNARDAAAARSATRNRERGPKAPEAARIRCVGADDAVDMIILLRVANV